MKELTITPPEGYEVDKEKSTFEKIVFKPIDTKPRSWREYCELESEFDGVGINWNCGGVQTTGLHYRGKAIVPTNLAAPFIAMMQLMSLRQEWIHKWSLERGLTKDWEPVWDGKIYNCCILVYNNKCDIIELSAQHHPLSFPTQEMANDFMYCFKDLLEQAKILL